MWPRLTEASSHSLTRQSAPPVTMKRLRGSTARARQPSLCTSCTLCTTAPACHACCVRLQAGVCKGRLSCDWLLGRMRRGPVDAVDG